MLGQKNVVLFPEIGRVRIFLSLTDLFVYRSGVQTKWFPLETSVVAMLSITIIISVISLD